MQIAANPCHVWLLISLQIAESENDNGAVHMSLIDE